ncbi:hypothetical protein NP233_g10074 [Leucocoprinus birnbaumii]|uniref:Nephrocystin 3-like N-terminal domain-containing protein n=1 Tax=Leucocoprinus birnbaumii TaxID=56174 RepID=A0AAD5YS93_9AGAR|nr:hypothetical protein NP233_g10074 [Leucocoprinus birnbaumii]
MPRRTHHFFSRLSDFFDQHLSQSPPILIPIDSEASTEAPSSQPPSTAATGSHNAARPPEPTNACAPPPDSTSSLRYISTPVSSPHSNTSPNVSSSRSLTPVALPITHVLPASPGLAPNVRPLLPGTFTPSNMSSSTLPQAQSQGMFTQAHDLIITNSHFTNYNTHYSVYIPGSAKGLRKLLDNSMPDAFHDAAARYPPPKCHYGTRKEYIAHITDWALGNSDYQTPILWMHGPFGIGKTAVAQSCAEAFKTSHKLLATLFFSRSNANRDDPLRVFTSIAYQITTLCEPFATIIDTRIQKDLSLTSKSLSTQFEELLVIPFSQIDPVANRLEGRIIIIDGLDECRGIAQQCEIIRIIAASASSQSTPFRWFITSRSEDSIVRAMHSSSISPSVSHLELPVSRDLDHEILLFLTDEFAKIRDSHNLPESWPTEAALALLVERAAGLWIYISTIVRFIKDEDSFGPEDQLRIALDFAESMSNRVWLINPLAEMDFFYTLILEQIPLSICTIIRKILLIHLIYPQEDSGRDIDILCLSPEQFRRACAFIKSVMELREGDYPSTRLHFYHASFIDFLSDSTRSGKFCILGEFLVQHRRELLERLHFTYSHTTDSSRFVFPSVLPKNVQGQDHYEETVLYFWRLCSFPNHPIDTPTAISMSKIHFKKMFSLLSKGTPWYLASVCMDRLRQNLPAEIRDQVHREDECPTIGCTNPYPVYIFGCGDTEVIGEIDWNRNLLFRNNQNPPNGRCPCGYRIKRVGKDGGSTDSFDDWYSRTRDYIPSGNKSSEEYILDSDSG